MAIFWKDSRRLLKTSQKLDPNRRRVSVEGFFRFFHLNSKCGMEDVDDTCIELTSNLIISPWWWLVNQSVKITSPLKR